MLNLCIPGKEGNSYKPNLEQSGAKQLTSCFTRKHRRGLAQHRARSAQRLAASADAQEAGGQTKESALQGKEAGGGEQRVKARSNAKATSPPGGAKKVWGGHDIHLVASR